MQFINIVKILGEIWSQFFYVFTFHGGFNYSNIDLN